ncbi:MAG: hypothetical protein QXV06_00940 [Ignisphaera sp.]
MAKKHKFDMPIIAYRDRLTRFLHLPPKAVQSLRCRCCLPEESYLDI